MGGIFSVYPRQNYMCPEEMASDNDLKRDLFKHIDRGYGFGKEIDELQRPLTVEEIHRIYRVMELCEERKKNERKFKVEPNGISIH